MGKPHVMAVPYPAQGHVIPLMQVAQCLANNGVRVTFVNTEFNHNRVVNAFSQGGNIHELISLVWVPDGLESQEDRNNHAKLAEAMTNVMPGRLEELVERINGTESDEITCVLTDAYMAGAMEVAVKIGIKRASFLPSSVALWALLCNVQKLVDDGIIDSNGIPLKHQVIQLSPNMPPMNTHHFAWTCLPDLTMKKTIFQFILQNNESVKLAQRLICNTSPHLEPGALDFVPNTIPIGPLLASHGQQSGHFWPEDSTCLTWLDQQPPNSVIYVAFGSFTVFDETQFRELALGLEQTNRPFLWVVRQDITHDLDEAYPDGFKDRVKDRAKMAHWAPQQKILSHPSVACFLSHCGWNSTIESVSSGVPFLCWPYFADQFLNLSYIVDDWGVGLRLDRDEFGIITGHEIKTKVEKVLSDECFKTKALELKDKVNAGAKQGGCTQEKFHEFIDWIKEM